MAFLLLFFSIRVASDSPYQWPVSPPDELISMLLLIIGLNIIIGIVAVSTNKYFNFIIWPLLIINIFICFMGVLGFYCVPVFILCIIPLGITCILTMILGGVKDYVSIKSVCNKSRNKTESAYIEPKTIDDSENNNLIKHN